MSADIQCCPRKENLQIISCDICAFWLLLLYPPPRSRSEVQMEQGKLEGWCSGWYSFAIAAIAQLGERQTEDLKVPGSIPGLGTLAILQRHRHFGAASALRICIYIYKAFILVPLF